MQQIKQSKEISNPPTEMEPRGLWQCEQGSETKARPFAATREYEPSP